MPPTISTVEIFFSGLLAFYHDRDHLPNRVTVGVLHGAPEHNFTITALVSTLEETMSVALGTPLAETEIEIRPPDNVGLDFDTASLSMLTIDGAGFHNEHRLEWGENLKPGVQVFGGRFSRGAEEFFRVVQLPLPTTLPIDDRAFTAVLKDTIPLGEGEHLRLVAGAEQWRFPAVEGVNYKLIVSNLPPFFFGSMHEHEHAAGHAGHSAPSPSHFQFYYNLGFKNPPVDRFELLEAAQPHPSREPIEFPEARVVAKYPCLFIHLSNSPPPGP